MILREVQGDIFDTTMNTIAVPTNCMGVMGAGLAKQVAERYPEVFRAYKKIHRTAGLADDGLFLLDSRDQRLFLIFPTKRHWKDRSSLAMLDRNLQRLARDYRLGLYPNMTGLAVPPLGSGLGRLPYEAVNLLLWKYLDPLDLEVELYLPRQ